MNYKRIAIILAIACCFGALDYFAHQYDLEEGEAGYDTYGGFGAGCFLLSLPVIAMRYSAWTFISKTFLHDSSVSILDCRDYLPILFTDIILIFGLVGLLYGLRYLWRIVRGKRKLAAT